MSIMPTGNVVVSASVIADIAVAGGLITGENPSGTVTGTNNLTQNDPQQATGSVPTGGIGIAFIASGGSTTNLDPTSWTAGATGSWARSATLKSYTSGDACCAGASTTSTGSVTASATGNSAWAFGNGDIAMVTFSPASTAPTTLASIAIPRKMFLPPKKSVGRATFRPMAKTPGIALSSAPERSCLDVVLSSMLINIGEAHSYSNVDFAADHIERHPQFRFNASEERDTDRWRVGRDFVRLDKAALNNNFCQKTRSRLQGVQSRWQRRKRV